MPLLVKFQNQPIHYKLNFKAMITNKWPENSEKKKTIPRNYLQSYRGWFLVLSTNDCHIGYKGRTAMAWHFLRDYLHFKYESKSFFCWSGVNYTVTKVGLLSFSEREFYLSMKNWNDMDGELVVSEWKLVTDGKKQWIGETKEQYAHLVVTTLASVTGDSVEIAVHLSFWLTALACFGSWL